MGRLHTRYSPVRRFLPEGISLDLHVLGLSLAFILSQDQTLRCIFFYPLFPIRENNQKINGSQSRLSGLSLTDGKALHSLYPRIVLLVYFADKSFKDRFPLNKGLKKCLRFWHRHVFHFYSPAIEG